ncbi:putative WD repeat-containing protein alr2800 [Nostoc sp, PCC 7120] [Rhizoctonia solani]|uniref:Putative WD repeat-containing protein alr2800 [Nostoc sp, PCC 7120] n=1 Tax=Rhizoctonia solani TaxID=456999 RepID=A0A0K6GIK6_9AGAM|nr:putative WD repeat-containing protein alr2800 [Nostoc sp, PCC 7120] [Rhizoctonia solani]
MARGDMSDETRRIIHDIQGQVSHVTRQKNRSTLRRMVGALKDVDESMRRYRRIEVLFTQLQVNLSIGTKNLVNETLVDSRLRGMRPAHEASYNSIQSTDIKRRACTENTRVGVLAGIWEWILHPNGPKIYWMNGMAGTGKTTIAYTTCVQLEENNQLGANFFCSRALPGCRDVGRIIPTIAYQLARSFPSFQSQLCQILAHDPDASTRDLTTQFRKLLKEPMKHIKDILPDNIVVLIDALDELDGPSSARLVLKVLFDNVAGMPVKFFITSRPDHGLYDTIMSQGPRMRDVFHLHEIEESFVQADIETYLRAELGPLSLPSGQIQQLAEQAGRFFIYAATAIEYIEPSDPEADHNVRLATLLQLTSEQPNMRQQKIDGLYAAILRVVFENPSRDPIELKNIRLTLWSVICAHEPLTSASLSNLIRIGDRQRVVLALKPLRSVLHISEFTGHISTLHASFPDFMFSPERSGKYACNTLVHHGLLAERCFEMMKDQLRFNICGIDSAFILDKQQPGLQATTNTTITPELFYSCQYWGAHLQLSVATNLKSLIAHLNELLERRLLAWIEVLTLKQAIGQGESILGTAERWLQSSGSGATPDIRQLMHDSWRFVTSFAASPASASTPHIYISALALWHTKSPILKWYGYLIQDWIEEIQARIKHNPALLATWDTETGLRVRSIALSPDGTRLVSGNYSLQGGDARIWDVRTGSVLLKQSTTIPSGVRSVAFSNDGTRIALGRSNGSVCICDAITGEAICGPFNCHSSGVNCVIFSHDDALVISCSDDGTINVINPTNDRAAIGPFRGHTEAVNSIALSPDDIHLISGSKDCTVLVWEMQTGRNSRALVGHRLEVLSVAYSSCGTRVVSGSADRTIRVWNPLTGDIVVSPFGRDFGMVNSVAFSPDGHRIISGFSDCVVAVYGSLTGQFITGPLQGHPAAVNAITVSPDNTRIFSVSDDGTICVWDMNLHGSTHDSNTRPMGHSAPVEIISVPTGGESITSITSTGEVGSWDLSTGQAVTRPTMLPRTIGFGSVNHLLAVSSDKQLIASSNLEYEIDIWDASTGEHLHDSFPRYSDAVLSVAFSSDNLYLISSSSDRTIRWCTVSAGAVFLSLEGHSGRALSVALSHNTDYAAAGTDTNAVYVWALRHTHRLVRIYKGHSGPVNSVDFSPQGTQLMLASGSSDGSVRVWDIATRGTYENSTTPGSGGNDLLPAVNLVKFSPNATCIVSSSSDHAIRVWSATTVELLAGPFKGHNDVIRALTFSPDSIRVISGSSDQTIRTWIVNTGSASHTPSTSIDTTSVSNSDMLGSWRLDDSGWVLDRTGRLLIWVPNPLRPALEWPCNPLVISTAGSLRLPMADLLGGRIWRDLCQRQAKN